MTSTEEGTRIVPPSGDPGHLVSVRDWEEIVQFAQQGDAHEHLARKLGPSSFPSVTGFVQAKYNGGSEPGGKPTFGVFHDAETPLANGYAASIANYFSHNTNETSAHFMVGPDATYQMLDTSLIAWHCGNGNQRSIGMEQTGYAADTCAEWTDSSGMAQINRVAALMRDIQRAHGIGTYFMTDQQLLAAWHGQIVGGWATHDQCRRVLGGTTHTDPMPNYPFDVLEQVLGGNPTPPPTPPPPPPARPQRLAWIIPRGQYIGAKTGPNASHGGDPRYDSPAICNLVQNVLEWFVYRGCVPGVPSSSWQTTTWTHGGWDAPYGDPAAIRWHARFYPGQPFPAEIWSDDYARLTA